MHLACRILETSAEHHIAAALPVNGMFFCESAKAGEKAVGVRKARGVKLGIAAGKPAGIALGAEAHRQVAKKE